MPIPAWSAMNRRLRDLLSSDREREMTDELALHLEMQERELVRRGMDPQAAHRAALQSFGGMEHARESYRDASGIPLVEHLLRDARYAFRRLRRAPSFAFGVIATLGVGVGVAVSIGALVYGVLLRPLPYRDSDRLVEVTLRAPGLDGGAEHAHSPASFVHVRDASRSFAAFGGYYINDAVNLTDLDDPQRVTAVMITPGTFAALDVKPLLGRLLDDADARVGFAGVVPILISHDLWRDRYGANRALVEGTIEVNRRPRRVVGVLPPGFAFPLPAAAVYFPAEVAVTRGRLEGRYINAIARLRGEVSPEEAEAELAIRLRGIAERFPEITDDLRRSDAVLHVQPLKDAIVAPVADHLRMLALTMVFVLLIVVANVSNLFLMRAQRLSGEIAIAKALGAGAAALLRRFVAEGLMLGAASALVALPVVAVALTSRFGFSERELPRLHEVTMGPGPAAAALLLSLLLGACIGALGFTRTRRVQLHDGLRASSRNTTSGVVWRRIQQSLVTAQVAVALALLAGAALFGRSLWNLRTVELGFTPEQRYAFEVTLPFRGYENYTRVALFHDAVLERVRAVPGVRRAEVALEIPLIRENPTDLSLEYDAVGTETSIRAAANMTTADYFRVMGIPMLHGRSFETGDVRASNPALVLSASLARALFGSEDVVGRLVRPPGPGEDIFHRVVGVVGDVPRWTIEAGPSRMAYFPLLRDGDGLPVDSVRIPILPSTVRYVVESDLPLAHLAPALRSAVRAVDPRVPVAHMTSLNAMVDMATARVRLTMLLLAAAAAAALLLGVVGIYSVVSYAVAGRRREIGVRLALGATPFRIERMVLREGTSALALGGVLGVAAAIAGGRFAQSLLYGVNPGDPLLLGSAVLVLLIAGISANWLPARSAARLDPAAVMRGDE